MSESSSRSTLDLLPKTLLGLKGLKENKMHIVDKIYAPDCTEKMFTKIKPFMTAK